MRVRIGLALLLGIAGCASQPATYIDAEGKERPCTSDTVVLEFTILEDGSVIDPEVVRSAADGMFDESALRAIKRWKFKPKMVHGVAVTRRASLPIEFSPPGCDGKNRASTTAMPFEQTLEK